MRKHDASAEYLLHELQIHQIELEMQNEELKRVNEDLEVSLKKYSGLYNFAPIGFFTVNAKGGILNANSTWIALLGSCSGQVLNNLLFQDFIDKDSLFDFDTFSKKVFNTEIKQNCELILLKKDGTRINAHLDGVAIQSQEYNGKQMLLAITDVTNYRRIENQLTQAQLLDKLKTEFFSNISHELRTPLNVIFASLQLIELYNKSDASDNRTLNIDKNHHTIKQNCRRLLRLVNNLIDSTKIDSGNYEPYFQNDDIVQIIKNITLSVKQFVECRNISLEFNSNLKEKIIQCDQELIERVLLNILSNAVKFKNPGCKINVVLFEKDGKIIISIKDNGIGIPKDKLEVIFHRFKQVDKGLTRDCEGSGLGLNLAKSIVEMHHGTISAKSVFSKGSEFIIELPDRVLKQENLKIVKKDNENKLSHMEKINIEFSDIYF